jgi:spermidine synthase
VIRRSRPRLVTVAAPWLEEPGVVRVLERATDGAAADTEREFSPGTNRPFILEQQDRRLLFFTMSNVQSTMRFDSPNALVERYLRKMMAFLLFVPRPAHIAILGLGGGSLTKFCYRYLPNTRLTVVELNAEVLALRNEFLVPGDDERLQVVHGDAEHHVRTCTDEMDVILVDAFDADGIAPSLANPAFYENARDRLGASGVFVMNLNGDTARYGATVRGALAAFGDRALLLSVGGRKNLLLFGLKSGNSHARLRHADQRASMLQTALALDFPTFLKCLRCAPTLRAASLRT